MSCNSNKAAVKRQGLVSNDDKAVKDGRRRGNEEEDEGECEKELESVSMAVTRQVCIKPIENTRNLDREVVLRRIRHRKRMNKVRAAVGTILGTRSSTTANDTTGGDASLLGKRWVDDAFAAL